MEDTGKKYFLQNMTSKKYDNDRLVRKLQILILKSPKVRKKLISNFTSQNANKLRAYFDDLLFLAKSPNSKNGRLSRDKFLYHKKSATEKCWLLQIFKTFQVLCRRFGRLPNLSFRMAPKK